MSTVSINRSGEPRRKRVRKGTRSCWECKRRKIRCVYQSEEEPICAGCLDRGSTCLSQEYVDEQEPSNGVRLGQRMGRVEQLLEQLMEKVEFGTKEPPRRYTPSTPVTESLGIDVLPPSSDPGVHFENAPVHPLFDNVVFGPYEAAPVDKDASTQPGFIPTPRSMVSTPSSRVDSKLDTLRGTLLAVMPPQHDVNLLCEASHNWWMIRRHLIHDARHLDGPDLTTPYSVDTRPESHPIIIARHLLTIAICCQQIAAGFDCSRLQASTTVAAIIQNCVAAASLVTSDDELVGSITGVECLLLQAGYQINAGNPRKGWLACRRAMSVGQLLGIHRVLRKRSRICDEASSTRAKFLWFQVLRSERYIALLLGLPNSTDTDPFAAESDEDAAKYLSTEDNYMRHLCSITGLVLDRKTEATNAFAVTQDIDEKIDALSKSMPSSWWELPKSKLAVQNRELAQQFDRLLAQIWHFQVEALVHLPFMLRAVTERRHEYSRFSCLRASREMVKRWIFLRHDSLIFNCHIIDFQAFTAAVILFLGVVTPVMEGQDPQTAQKEEDRLLIRRVLGFLETQRDKEDNEVAAQSADVLKTLLSINPEDPKTFGNLRLTIPYFGTIEVVNCGSEAEKTLTESAASIVTPQSDAPSEPQWKEIIPPPQGSVAQPPLLSFTSSLYPDLSVESGDWPFREADVMLFDSLVNSDMGGSDMGGNWNF